MVLMLTSRDAISQQSSVDSLINVLQENPSQDTARVNVLNEVAYKLFSLDIDKTKEYAEEARDLATKLEFLKGLAESLRILGIYNYFKSNYPEALSYYQQALEVNKELGDNRIAASCLNNTAVIYYRQGNYPRALENYQKALTIMEEMGVKDRVAACLDNIAIIHSEQNSRDLAFEYFQRSLVIREEIGEINAISTSLNNIGEFYLESFDYKSARDYFERSLKLKEEAGDKSGVSSILRNIGYIYFEDGDHQSAGNYYQRSLSLSEEIGFKYGICLAHARFGELYLETNRLSRALSSSLEGLDLAVELALLDEQKELNDLLSRVYSRQANYQKAYDHHVLFKQLNDSLFNKENIKNIADLENQYQYEKEKQEILFASERQQLVLTEENNRLKYERTTVLLGLGATIFFIGVIFFAYRREKKFSHELTNRNRTINELTQFRNGLTHMIAHDMKNALDAVINLSRGEPSKKKMATVEQSGYLVLNLVNNMLDVEKFEEAKVKINKKAHPLRDLIKEAIDQVDLPRKLRDVDLVANLSSDVTIMVDREVFVRVLVNLLTNAIKYSKVGGQVSVSLEISSNDRLSLSVQDNGPGIAKENLPHVFDKYWQGEKRKSGGSASTGLGLTYCKLAIEAHGGSITVDSEEGKGSTFTITLHEFETSGTTEEPAAEIAVSGNSKLSEAESASIKDELDELKSMKVHQITQLEKILGRLDDKPINESWRNKLRAVIYDGDQEQYDEMLEEVSG